MSKSKTESIQARATKAGLDLSTINALILWAGKHGPALVEAFLDLVEVFSDRPTPTPIFGASHDAGHCPAELVSALARSKASALQTLADILCAEHCATCDTHDH